MHPPQLPFLRMRRSAAWAVGGGAVLIVLAGATAVGLFGRIDARAGAPKDWALVTSVLLHGSAGLCLYAVLLLAGAGLVSLFPHHRNKSFSTLLLYGFPVSLALRVVVSLISIRVEFGWVFATAVLVALAAVPFRSSLRRQTLEAVQFMALTFPFALGYGGWMALQWHGPTSTLSGAPVEDTVHYATLSRGLLHSLLPLKDYSALGFKFPPFELLQPLVGAGVLRWINIDPIVWLLAGAGGAFVLNQSVVLWAYRNERSSITSRQALIGIVALLGAGLYPSWHIMSPPVLDIAPLVISIWYLVHDGRLRYGRELAVVVGLVGAALTKLTTMATLVSLGAAPIISADWKKRGRSRVTVACVVVVGVVAVVGLNVVFGSKFYFSYRMWSQGVRGLLFDNGDMGYLWPFLVRDAAMLGLIVVCFRIMPSLLAISLGAALVAAFVYPFLFMSCFIVVMTVVAVAVLDRTRNTIPRYVLPIVACATIGCLLTDVAGKKNGIVWICTVGASCGLALTRRVSVPRTRSFSAVLAGSALAVVLVAAAVGRQNWIVDSQWRYGRPSPLTPQVFDIWAKVRHETPSDSVVFTDQTGIEGTILKGWNAYARSGDRQVYLSDWVTNIDLRLDPRRRDAMLVCNQAVLDAATSPFSSGLLSKFGHAFAVTSVLTPLPSPWSPVYENSDWALSVWDGQATAQRTGPCQAAEDLPRP